MEYPEIRTELVFNGDQLGALIGAGTAAAGHVVRVPDGTPEDHRPYTILQFHYRCSPDCSIIHESLSMWTSRTILAATLANIYETVRDMGDELGFTAAIEQHRAHIRRTTEGTDR